MASCDSEMVVMMMMVNDLYVTMKTSEDFQTKLMDCFCFRTEELKEEWQRVRHDSVLHCFIDFFFEWNFLRADSKSTEFTFK